MCHQLVESPVLKNELICCQSELSWAICAATKQACTLPAQVSQSSFSGLLVPSYTTNLLSFQLADTGAAILFPISIGCVSTLLQAEIVMKEV